MIAPVASARLDLRAFACPMTWVKTRIALERLTEGGVLEVLLAAGEAAEGVPRSAAEEGHQVVTVESLGAGEGVRLVLLKRGRGGEGWP